MDAAYWQNMGWFGLVVVHLVVPFLWFIPGTFLIRIGVTALMATQHSWLMVILVANMAGTLSLVSQYFVSQWIGAERWLKKAESAKLVAKVSAALDTRMFASLVFFSASPLPESLLPLAASAKRYSVWKFTAAMFIGRLVHTIPMALGGIGLEWLWNYVHQ